MYWYKRHTRRIGIIIHIQGSGLTAHTHFSDPEPYEYAVYQQSRQYSNKHVRLRATAGANHMSCIAARTFVSTFKESAKKWHAQWQSRRHRSWNLTWLLIYKRKKIRSWLLFTSWIWYEMTIGKVRYSMKQTNLIIPKLPLRHRKNHSKLTNKYLHNMTAFLQFEA